MAAPGLRSQCHRLGQTSATHCGCTAALGAQNTMHGGASSVAILRAAVPSIWLHAPSSSPLFWVRTAGSLRSPSPSSTASASFLSGHSAVDSPLRTPPRRPGTAEPPGLNSPQERESPTKTAGRKPYRPQSVPYAGGGFGWTRKSTRCARTQWAATSRNNPSHFLPQQPIPLPSTRSPSHFLPHDGMSHLFCPLGPSLLSGIGLGLDGRSEAQLLSPPRGAPDAEPEDSRRQRRADTAARLEWVPMRRRLGGRTTEQVTHHFAVHSFPIDCRPRPLT